MKLQALETWVTVPPGGVGGSFWVILRITTDNGIRGLGECYGIPVSGDVACRMIEDTFARYIAGASPHDIETLFRRVYSAGFTQRPDVSMMGIFSGIEMAIWDILGKALEQPVYNLLGGRFHARLRTYTYLYPRNGRAYAKPDDPRAMFVMTVRPRQNVPSIISHKVLPRLKMTRWGRIVFKAGENYPSMN